MPRFGYTALGSHDSLDGSRADEGNLCSDALETLSLGDAGPHTPERPFPAQPDWGRHVRTPRTVPCGASSSGDEEPFAEPALGSESDGPFPVSPASASRRAEHVSVTAALSEHARRLASSDGMQLHFYGEWLFAVALVDFDQLVGPRVAYSEPDLGDVFADEFVQQLAFNAMPDASISDAEDCVFDTNWVVRCEHLRPGLACCDADTRPSVMHGYMYFQKRRCEKQRRGTVQRTIALLSFSKYDKLYYKMLGILRQCNCTDTLHVAAAQAAVNSIKNWPSNVFWNDCEKRLRRSTANSQCSVLELPFLGTLIRASHCPTQTLGSSDLYVYKHYPPLSLDRGPCRQLVLESDYCDFFCLFPLVESLWTVWELLVTNQSLVVLARTPEQSCSIVRALSLLTRRLDSRRTDTPVADVSVNRPYITIQDAHFRQIVHQAGAGRMHRTAPVFGPVVGMTNNLVVQLRPLSVLSAHGVPQTPSKSTACLSTPHVRSVSRDKLLLDMALRYQLQKQSGIELAIGISRYFDYLTGEFLRPIDAYLEHVRASGTPYSRERCLSFVLNSHRPPFKRGNGSSLYALFLSSPKMRNMWPQ